MQPNDTAAIIASRDDMASCPKCAKDLVEANPHRASVKHANGYLSFVEPLVPGERLWIPEKWGDGTLDRLSKEYFANLPSDPTGLGQIPPEHVPQLYEVQPGDTEQTIASKFGQTDSAPLIDANLAQPTTTQTDGSKTFCSITAGMLLALPDRWFAAGSSWSAVKPGCNASPQDVVAAPGAVAQVADQNHPAPKDITLAVHPSALDAMQSARGGARDTTSKVATAAAGTSAVIGTAVVGTFAAHLVTGVAYGSVQRYFSRVISDMF